jgi:EpsI family protein
MTRQFDAWLRFAMVAVVLAGAVLFLHLRGQAEKLPPSDPPASFPLQVGNWQGREVSIPQWALDVLGAGEFLERNYRRARNEPSVDFFLAYFPSQRTGSTMHSPQNCLPGSGWMPIEFARVESTRPGAGNIRINHYVLAKGLDRLLVLYWYQMHGRVVASEYWAKFYLVADAIRMNRTDGAMVRIMTPIAPNEGLTGAEQRGVAFLQDVLPLLDRYIPR